MTRIKVKNLLLRTYIGFNPEEQENKQDVIINFEIETEVSQEALETDEPDDILDYKIITKKRLTFLSIRDILALELSNKSVHSIDEPHYDI